MAAADAPAIFAADRSEFFGGID